MGDDCATGVAFTRDPSTGENSFYGEFLFNAQGEDVVAGIRTPLPLTIKEREKSGGSTPSLQAMPDVFLQLEDVRFRLKRITAICRIWNSRFSRASYMLQTRKGKRTVEAALRMAVEMAEENLITGTRHFAGLRRMHLTSCFAQHLIQKLKNLFDAGLPASPGAACGKIVLSADRAEEMAATGRAVILVRLESKPGGYMVCMRPLVF